jgi:soluble lytic murein transglycosylase-like protein
MIDYKTERYCFRQSVWIVFVAITAFAGDQPVRKASTVAVDPKSGRLVRTVVVAPKVIEPKVITPVEIGGEAVAGPLPDAAISALVEDAARRNGVDPLLVHSVIKAESNYNPKAVSNKGAQGLMQLMPATARDLGVKNAMDPKDNIEGGVKYLKYLQSQFSDTALALAAYNAGEGAVKRYNWIPPYAETQDYVVKVARNYKQARAAAAAVASKPVAPASAVAAAVPVEPLPPQIQYYYDAQGRLNLRTVNKN